MADLLTPDSRTLLTTLADRTVTFPASDRTLEVAGRLDDGLPLPVQPSQNQFLSGSIFIGAL